MKAAVLNQHNGKFDIEDIEVGEPRGYEVLVQVKASGLCHSDLHIAQGGYGVPLPAVLGHELAGIVNKIGPDVTEFSEGDHVVASLVRFCGHCIPCREKRTYQCTNPNATLRGADEDPRLTRNGQPVTAFYGTAAFAEFALIHENQLVKIPDELPFPQASVLGCGCITGAGAVINSAKVRPGETIAVIGVGGVGLNVITGAKLAGAGRIIAIDTQPSKKALAIKFGATDFIDVSKGEPVEQVNELIAGGVDHAFEVVGLKVTSLQAIRMVRLGGSAYLIGLHKPGESMNFDATLDIILRQVTLRGVYMGSTNIKVDIPVYANLYMQGRFNLDDLISGEINISEINDAYEQLKSGGIARCVITSF